MTIAIGSDHAGFEYKEVIKAYLEEKGFSVHDFGTHSEDSVDYPVIGKTVGMAVSAKEFDYGILICGTGVGISISANRVPGIRAVVCSEPYTAKLSKMHNNTNILAFGSRVVGIEMAKMIVDTWLETTYEGGRHQRRVDLMDDIYLECK